MSKFVFRATKRVWSVRTIRVDQYGKLLKDVPQVVHGNYPTHEEAEAARPQFATYNQQTWRWDPNDKNDGFEQVDIYHHDELVVVGSLAEVTMFLMGLKDK